jgi:hypothetical protein
VEGGILFYLCPSIQDIFLSNGWWQKSDIWSQASYRYTILWVAFLDPSDSYFLFADFVEFYTHWTYMLIFSATIDGRNLIFGHKLHIDTPYRGSVFGHVRFLLPVCRLSWFLFTLNIYTHFLSHFFSATIDVRDLIFGHMLHIGTHIMGSVFGPIRFLLPVCRLCWFLYTLNIHFVYAHF